MGDEAVFIDLPLGELDTSTLFLSFVLVAARVRAFMFVSPFFGPKAMSGIVRMGFIVAIASFAVPNSYIAIKELSPDYVPFFILLAKELFVGLILAVFLWMPIRSIELAGTVMDSQVGGSIGEDFDPITNTQSTTTANLLIKIFTGYFFAAGGFLIALDLLFNSYLIWPPSETFPLVTEVAVSAFIDTAGSIFLLALVLAIPVMGFMFLVDISVAYIAKSAPSLNALIFAMPVKAIVLVVMLGSYISLVFPQIFKIFKEALTYTENVISAS